MTTLTFPVAPVANRVDSLVAEGNVLRARAVCALRWLVAITCWIFALYQVRYAAIHLLPGTWFWAKGYPVYTRFPHCIFFIAHVLGCCGALFRAPFLFLRTEPFLPRGKARIESR